MYSAKDRWTLGEMLKSIVSRYQVGETMYDTPAKSNTNIRLDENHRPCQYH